MPDSRSALQIALAALGRLLARLFNRAPSPPAPPLTDLPPHLIAPRPTLPTERPAPPPDPLPAYVIGSYGVPSIDQHDALFVAASAAVQRKKGVRVDPRFVKAVMGQETGENGDYPVERCRPWDGHPGPRSCGPMQIKWPYHGQRCPECSQRTVAGHVELAAHIIGDTMLAHTCDEYEAYIREYLTSDDINGTSQQEAVRGLKRRVRQMERDAGTSQPEPPSRPEPAPITHPLLTITGGIPLAVTYGWLADAGLNYYGYGVGHGTHRPTQHPGIDIPLPCGTSLYAPSAGVVDCVGSAGIARWGQACGAYSDVDGGGKGNLTLFLDGGVKLTLGHVRNVFVNPGDRVTAGQKVATVGSMDGCHVHVETSIERSGTYWLVDPVAALRGVMRPPDPRADWITHDVPGAPNGLRLPPWIRVEVQLTPPGLNRSGRPLRPTGTVFHETGNRRLGAGARMHATWQANGTPGHPDGKIGVHAYIENDLIIVTIPLNEQGVHAGDSRNQTMLGYELCVNQDRNQELSERTAMHLHAATLSEVISPPTTAKAAMWSHTTSACPATINQSGRWHQIETETDRIITAGSASGESPLPRPEPPARPKYTGLTIPEHVFEALFPPDIPPDPHGPVTQAIIANRWYAPLHTRVVDGDDVYFTTGNGILRYRDGEVTKL